MANNTTSIGTMIDTPTLINQVVYIAESIILIFSSIALMLVILITKKLRERQEMLMIAGQASTYFIYGNYHHFTFNILYMMYVCLCYLMCVNLKKQSVFNLQA